MGVCGMQDNEYLIEVRNITKQFRRYYDRGTELKEMLMFRKRSRYEVRQVLKGISFSVRRGEAVGLIGHNGCGKSTTLKLLTKIMYPDSGEIIMRGRVSSLIELGAGFHPDMTGRENIYTNASIFGLTKKEIDARLHDIIAFSELEDYMDDPVRTYSSGMYMRLAFSVAINVDADILLIDEILAVGDTNFQSKCFNRLRELKARGMTIIIVTHDLSTVEKFCDRALWLNDGMIVKEGQSAGVVDAYFDFMNRKRLEEEETEEMQPALPEQSAPSMPPQEETDAQPEKLPDRFGMRDIEITQARMRSSSGKLTRMFRTGEAMRIEMDYLIHKPLDEYVFGFGFYTVEGECLYGNNTQLDRLRITSGKDTGTIAVEIERLPLLAGIYHLNVAVVDKDGTPMDFYRNYCEFEVVSDDRSTGCIQVLHTWKVQE